MPPALRRGRPALAALTALIALIGLAVAAPARAADARAARACPSADLRYPFTEGGPKTFGVFRLRVAGASCTTAHRVAKRWMRRFEAQLSAGRVRLPRAVLGFRFRRLPPNAAQTYRLRGRRGSATIRFDYVVPNG